MAIRQISPHAFLVGGPDLSDPRDALTYLVAGPETVVLIDAGTGPETDRILGNVKQTCGKSPDILVLTHTHIDHTGGAAEIKRRTGCKVWVHKAEAGVLREGDPVRSAAGWYGMDLEPLTPDRTLGQEATIQLGQGLALNLIHTPGHTPGSISAWLDDGSARVLFGQDIHGPFAAEFGSDLKAWARSMKTLLDLEADILAEGHYGVFEPGSRVRGFILGQLSEHGLGDVD